MSSGCCVPVFFLEKRQVVLMDSGLQGGMGEALLDFLVREGLSVRAVLTSHAHIDHTGNHRLLQKRYGAKVFASLFNAAVLENPLGLKAYFYEDTYQELLQHREAMYCQTDQLILPGQETVEVEGASFAILPLPGHAPEHMGFITPDKVCYVADLLLGRKELYRTKLPYVMCCGSDLRSKRMAQDWAYSGYLLAHCGYVSGSELGSLAASNIEMWRDNLEQTMKCFSKPITLSDAVTSVLQAMGLSSRNSFRWMAFERTIRAMVQYLVDVGCLKKYLTGTQALFVKTEKPLDKI